MHLVKVLALSVFSLSATVNGSPIERRANDDVLDLASPASQLYQANIRVLTIQLIRRVQTQSLILR